MLYTDFNRLHWIGVYPRWENPYRYDIDSELETAFRATMLERCAPIVRSWAPRFKKRLVFGLPWLREKLLAWENNLDDRLLEAFKLVLVRDMSSGNMNPRATIVLEAVEDERLIFEFCGVTGEDGTHIFQRRSVALSELEQCKVDIQPIADRLHERIVDWREPLLPSRSVPSEPA